MTLSPDLWAKLHGASTHFPIALVMVSMVFDGLGYFIPRLRQDLHSAGYYTIIVGVLGAFPAVLSGLLMTRGSLLGHGALFWHHVFVWPAFACMTGLAVWRVVVGRNAARRSFAIYLMVAVITAGLCAGAGYWGGEILPSSQ